MTGSLDSWVLAGLLTLAFAFLARRMRGVTNSGAIAGAISCLVLYQGGGLRAFVALITVFALAWITTRLGYQRKQSSVRRNAAMAERVRRSWPIWGSRLLAPAISLFGHSRRFFLLAMAAALSEAAADTISSELGQAFAREARLITTWSPVPPGTDGAVSLAGTMAGAIAAGLVSFVCVLGGLLPSPLAANFGGLPAILGMFADSFLGAWLERRRLVNNDSVNFLGTLMAALAAFWLASIA